MKSYLDPLDSSGSLILMWATGMAQSLVQVESSQCQVDPKWSQAKSSHWANALYIHIHIYIYTHICCWYLYLNLNMYIYIYDYVFIYHTYTFFPQQMLRVSFYPGRDRACRHCWSSSLGAPLWKNGCYLLRVHPSDNIWTTRDKILTSKVLTQF